MINYDMLKSLSFEEEDIGYILENDLKYRDRVLPFSREFISNCEKRKRTPFSIEEWGEKKNYTFDILKRLNKRVPDADNEYILNLLFWLYCIPFAKKYYDENEIPEEIFFDTMKDVSCKTRECKEVTGKIGVSSIWFFLHFNFVYFALGRLQFCIDSYGFKEYSFDSFKIKKGDKVYSCHIPSGERLTVEDCMESFDKAYKFFDGGDVIPIVCASWLLFPPYIERVFKKDSNLWRFAKLFDITETSETGRNFADCERVFGKSFEGTTEGFPRDTSLQRAFIDYIDSGDDFGCGIGIILYNGKERRIINREIPQST